MKFQSAMMSVGNILISIIVFISTIYNHMYYYEGNKSMFYVLMFLVVIANGILAVANHKRNKAITILDAIIAVLWIMVVTIGSTASVDSDLSSSFLILKGIVVLIVILSMVVFIFIPKTKKATELNEINIIVEKKKKTIADEETKEIDEAFKVKKVNGKEEAVGIANLLSKMIIPVLWGIFAIVLVIQIIEPSKAYNEDKEKLLNGLKAIEGYQQKRGYIYQSAENEYQFLDENGTYLNRITAEKLSNFDDNYVWKINYPDEKHVIEVLIAKQKDKVVVINTEGKSFFELEKRYTGEPYLTVCYLIKQAKESGDIPSTAGIIYEKDKERDPTATVTELEPKTEQEYGFKTKVNAYYKMNTNGEFKEFETNLGYKYQYFKNVSFSDYIIQIAITKENSAQVPFLEKYLKHKEKVFNITDEHKKAIQEFYRFKKEYKLINPSTKAVIDINAQDMLYDTYTIDGEEQEVIYAYSDGSIPFMNAEYNSFVAPDGRIFGALSSSGNEASIFTLVDNFNVIATRIDTQLSILYNKDILLQQGAFKENRHEGKKIIDLGQCYYLYPIDKADTNKECMIQTKGYSLDVGVVKSEISKVKFVGPTLLTIYNTKDRIYETYYYSRGDLLKLYRQNTDFKMYAVDMETALPGGYGPYELIGIYDK